MDGRAREVVMRRARRLRLERGTGVGLDRLGMIVSMSVGKFEIEMGNKTQHAPSTALSKGSRV